MSELKPRIHDEETGLDYILADLNEQAQNRYRFIVRQMMEAEGVIEDLKRWSQWEWIIAMSSIVSRAEERT